MHEFAPGMTVFIADEAGQVRRTSVPELLPDSFGVDDLKRNTELHRENQRGEDA